MSSRPELNIVLASEIEDGRQRWPHAPHCPHCHHRLATPDPKGYRRTRGYLLAEFDGKTCPHCATDVNAPPRRSQP